MTVTINGTTGITTPDLTSADDITANGSTVLTAATSPAALPLAGGTLTGNVNLGDNVKAIFGAGSDLQIWHSGDDSYVGEIGTGNLVLFGDANVDIQNAAGQKTFRGESGGAANLFHANSVKLATSATGVTVTGTVAATAYTGDGSALTGVGGSTTFGAVGTYIWGRPANLTDYAAGATASGLYATSSKNPDSPPYYTSYVSGGWDSGITVATSVSGTWRCMAGTGKYSPYYAPSSLWVRIS
jgi:hypothetical protein